MPTAKKPPARKPTARGAPRSSASKSTATRREVERSIARFEKLLDDAGDALQSLSKDLGRGAQDAYKELTKTMKALRRDAAKTNRNLLKDFDQAARRRHAIRYHATRVDENYRAVRRYTHGCPFEPVNQRRSLRRLGLDRQADDRFRREQIAIHDDRRLLEQNSHISPPLQRLPGALTKRGDAHRIVTAPASLAVHPGCNPPTRTERRVCCTPALRQASRRLPTPPTSKNPRSPIASAP